MRPTPTRLDPGRVGRCLLCRTLADAVADSPTPREGFAVQAVSWFGSMSRAHETRTPTQARDRTSSRWHRAARPRSRVRAVSARAHRRVVNARGSRRPDCVQRFPPRRRSGPGYAPRVLPPALTASRCRHRLSEMYQSVACWPVLDRAVASGERAVCPAQRRQGSTQPYGAARSDVFGKQMVPSTSATSHIARRPRRRATRGGRVRSSSQTLTSLGSKRRRLPHFR
jgi:hypothetical protein